MSGMLDGMSDFISSTIGNLPLALLTIALLVTPTMLWVVYRLAMSGASSARSRISTLPAALWVCPVCRSVNDPSSDRCYRCSFKVANPDDVLIIDPVTAKPIPFPDVQPEPQGYPGVAVGPGVPLVPVAVGYTASQNGSTVPGPVETGVPVGAGAPRGRSDRVPSGQPSMATAVGARRPFDPRPDQGVRTQPATSDVEATPSGPQTSAMATPAPPSATAPIRPAAVPPPRIVVTAPRNSDVPTQTDEVGSTAS
jgi:hypothetical protein